MRSVPLVFSAKAEPLDELYALSCLAEKVRCTLAFNLNADVANDLVGSRASGFLRGVGGVIPNFEPDDVITQAQRQIDCGRLVRRHTVERGQKFFA